MQNQGYTFPFLLRNQSDLSDVQPEDIEDVSRKYRAFLGVEYESDTIKKVYIRREDGTLEREVYVISLIEQKSDIDYDVAMQLLRYMTVNQLSTFFLHVHTPVQDNLPIV